MGSRLVRVGLLVGLVGGSLSWSVIYSIPAFAACHHFTVAASPSSVSQGGKVTVTVSRDGNLAASNVHVSTVDGTAKAPADYTKLDQTVNFTNEKSRMYSVAIAKDSKADPAETFRLHLSNPGGCAPNPSYVLDPDVTVTIKANAVSTPKPTAHPTSTSVVHRANATPTASLAATPSPSPEVSASPETTPSPQAAAPVTKSKNRSGLAIAGIAVGAVAVISAGGLFLYRRRMT